jgi:adenine-specific DNA-methyltransferase
MAKKKSTAKPAANKPVDEYRHPEANGPRVPDAGAEPFLQSRHAPGKYRYDSSLSPALEWDEQNPARERAEALIREILDAENLQAAKAAAAKLKAMSGPFLNWAGKAERPEIEVPTLPLFVHERLSTKGIIETLKGHRRNKQQTLFDLFNDPNRSFGEQATRAYEHGEKRSNRMILGDNLQARNV